MINDETFMQRAIALGDLASKGGEEPFGSLVVAPDGAVIGTGEQRTVRDNDMSRHAEIVAMANAIKDKDGKLRGCTLYSTVEPCAMCSFIARQYEVSRVVFGLKAPITGGYSNWHILDNDKINHTIMGFFDAAFAEPPEILPGVCVDEVIAMWKRWNRLATDVMLLKRVFTK